MRHFALVLLVCSTACSGMEGLGDPYNRGIRYLRSYQFANAEEAFRKSLEIREQRYGATDPHTAGNLMLLGSALQEQGRYAEAADVQRRGLTIFESRLEPTHKSIAVASSDLAVTLFRADRSAEGVPLLLRAINIGDRNAQVDTELRGLFRMNLAVMYHDLGRHEEALPLFAEAVNIFEEDGVTGQLPGALHNLAWGMQALGRSEEAQPLLERALALVAERGIPGDPFAGHYHATIAVGLENDGKVEEALNEVRLAQALQVERLRAIGQSAAAAPRIERTSDRIFPNVIRIGAKLAGSQDFSNPVIVDESFQAAQILSLTNAAEAVARIADRFATGESALAVAIRARQDNQARLRAADAELLDAVSKGSGAAAAALRREIRTLATELAAQDAAISEDHPTYQALVGDEPIKVADVQSMLRPDEALVMFKMLARDKYYLREEAAFAWLLRADQAEFRRLDIGPSDVDSIVSTLRASLDPGQGGGIDVEFDSKLAHELHSAVLSFSGEAMQGVQHLLIVPDGALESFPFQLLVTELKDEIGDVAWLARRFATTTLPSVGSLRALREFAKPSRATAPFVGIGDPVLNEHGDGARNVSVGALFGSRGLADVDVLRQLPSLPETSDELKALASFLGSDDDALYLGERASESIVRSASLESARVVAFATHAAVAGVFDGVAEPALVLTPPDVASAADDGLLTASEAATLKLDADFVLLSACSTAAPDGTLGARGLSGLARAFIYAGSRSLLVSHWDVYSEATARLTTGMFAHLERTPGVGAAEALRRAMLALIDSGDPMLAHPAAWAPFVIVGDGGSRPSARGAAALLSLR